MSPLKVLLATTVKESYLGVMRLLPPSRRKQATIVYYMTFADNDAGLIQNLAGQFGQDFVVFATPKAEPQASALAASGVHVVLLGRSKLLLQNAISYLKQATVVITDDYFPELVLAKKARGVILLWHANGAIKRFGWQDPANRERPAGDQRRFKQVYSRYTDILTGSDTMGQIFQQSFAVPASVIRPIGFLRSDTLVNAKPSDGAPIDFLYAPTYRDAPGEMQRVLQMALHVFERVKQHHFVIKLHPSVPHDILLRLPDNVQVSQESLNLLLDRSRVLITDYSSTLFDYLLVRPHPQTILFCPDLLSYQQKPGLQASFEDGQMGPLVVDGAQLYDTIVRSRFGSDDTLTDALAARWNQYNDGHVKARVTALIQQYLTINEK
ncbi:CDP-glycerol glycerophosphotransferase family protein [Lacticaseibacillus mingshuiensis]|uniref:CDP-glycerol glycerophosphotransferase family protein n=1 Tax=Lacticaseibacillus mingshuiensis TaxID=2799574 RepID=A0ABW4CFE4_9LACO|nr:CDP-glycerol glycerophosphotransferase family protein [Lacticaseibacillus mingshuiensis]